MEDSIIVKRPTHRPEFLLPQFGLRTGAVVIENQALGLEVSKFQSLQVTSQWGVLGLSSLSIANIKGGGALAGVAQWIEHWPANQKVANQKVAGQFLVRARAWVVPQVPSRGRASGDHILMFVSLSFSLPSSVPKNR